jgi:hypothetical protein
VEIFSVLFNYAHPIHTNRHFFNRSTEWPKDATLGFGSVAAFFRALPYNRSVEETASTPTGSKPFIIFDANINRLTSLASTPYSQLAETADRLRQQTEKSTSTAKEFGEALRVWRESGSNESDFQKYLTPLLAEVTTVNEIVTEYVGLVKTRQFLGTWMIVMLVTFAEAYLEDVLSLLISDGLQTASLPPDVAAEINKRWVKNLMREKPHAWIKQLERFGVTGYDPDLAEKMQTIWNRRHNIAHTAEPEISPTVSQELVDAVIVVGKGFVEVTDAFVASKSS